MDANLINNLSDKGIGGIFALALLWIIMHQFKDLRDEQRSQLKQLRDDTRMIVNNSLSADNQLRSQIFKHNQRLAKCEEDIHDIKGMLGDRRKP